MRIAIVALVLAAGCGSSVAGDPRSLCARYVACVGERNPQDLVSVQQTYGPQGACWISGIPAATCAQQCQHGLSELLDPTGVYPDCNSCATSLDCGGYQRSLVCDTSAGKCVECLKDSDCRVQGGTGLCGSDHSCHTCATSGQCASGQVCAPSGACCQPSTCDANQCGDVDDGCGGMLHCGSCARGSCNGGTCSTVGTACTVGDGTCLGGEACMFDSLSKAHVCAYTYPDGMECNYGGTPPLCSFTYDLKQWATMTCIGRVCERYCLSSGDCAAGKTCMPSSAGVAVTPDHPGICG